MNNEIKIALIKAKTLRDSLSGKEPDQELMKALQIGQTKVVNGVTYVVKMTPNGTLDWRVLKPTKKSGKKKNLKKIEDLFDTADFPDLSDLKEVSSLGGSTGAKLVEDTKTGKKYVMKQGNSKEHVEEEFMANAIYKLFDVKVPNMKLYKGDVESTVLSDYIPNTVPANEIMDEQLRDDIADNYILDCLLSNWDVYKNDNILIDTDTGDFIRVDNGGALRYSAQGRPKGEDFSEEVEEIDTMALHNPFMAEGLTDAKMKKQIKQILLKGENIISIIEDDDLKKKMYARLMDLKEFVTDEPKDPYRQLKERDLKRALRRAGHVMNTNNKQGWIFLSEICKMRGFDGTPEMLPSKEFDKQLKQEGALLLNRGLTGSYGKTAKDYMKEFTESEDCFYGTQAMYGAGIYAAVNAAKKNPPPPNDDYAIALDYAGFEKNHILDILVTPDTRIVDADELDRMMNEEFFGEEFKEKKDEYDKINDVYNELKNQKERIEDEIDFNVKKDLGWNEKSFNVLNRAKPEEVYADTEKFSFQKPLRFYTKLIESLNGTVQKIDKTTYEIKLPNTAKTFWLSPEIAERSLKQKNANTNPYNYHYKRLKEFIKENHYNLIRGKVADEIEKRRRDDPKMVGINDKMKEAQSKIKDLADEIEKIKTTGSSTVNEVMAEIIKRPGGTHRGFYAAIKGYDMIVNKRGWGTNTDFAVILNRSKVKVREFK